MVAFHISHTAYLLLSFFSLFIWIISHTYIHELTHFYTAVSLKKESCGIIIFNKKKTKVLRNKYNLTIATAPLNNCSGLTLLEDNFTGFTESQIKKIAIYPRIAQIIYLVFLRVVFLIISAYLLPVFARFFIIYDLIITGFVIFLSLRKTDSGWNDINIFLHPTEFVNYINNYAPKEERYEYWRDNLCMLSTQKKMKMQKKMEF